MISAAVARPCSPRALAMASKRLPRWSTARAAMTPLLSAQALIPLNLPRVILTFMLASSALYRISLEFTRPLFGPALNYNFLFRIEFDGVTSLGVHIAKEAVLPARE